MTIKRTFKHYLKLNQIQRKSLDKVLETCCWFYNYLLEQYRIRDKNNQKQPTEFELINSIVQIKRDNLLLEQVYSTTLQEIAKQIYKIWNRFLELKEQEPKKKYPKFKPIHRYNSFINSQLTSRKCCGFELDNSPLTKKKEARKLKISLGRGNHPIAVKMIMERNIQGIMKVLTVKRKNGRYYALFSCDRLEKRLLPALDKNVGIDVNLNKQSYITLSNGKKYKHPDTYNKTEKKLMEASKSLSRKVEKSQNWLDAKLQLAKKWEKVVKQFKYEIYQVANELVKKYDSIAIEKLQIRNMIKNRCLAKSIQQARWGILFKVIAEAAEIATRQFVRVNPRNTTQTCSDCGELAKEKIKLNQRIFECWNCELELDRDVNSARNILNRAILENRFDQNLPLNKENYF